MREMLATTAALVGQGLGKKVAIVTLDGGGDKRWVLLGTDYVLSLIQI